MIVTICNEKINLKNNDYIEYRWRNILTYIARIKKISYGYFVVEDIVLIKPNGENHPQYFSECYITFINIYKIRKLSKQETKMIMLKYVV